MMDEGATLKMILAASEGLPNFAREARGIISKNFHSKNKRALWSTYEIRLEDVLTFIDDVSHNIASTRDKAFVKRETLVLLGKEGVRPKRGEQTCLFDACCETAISPKAIVGEARVSGEGVLIYQHEGQEFVKNGRQRQLCRVTHEDFVTHIHELEQEAVTDVCFKKLLDRGSLIGSVGSREAARML